MFSCEYWKIFKNSYFEKHLLTATSGTNKDIVIMKVLAVIAVIKIMMILKYNQQKTMQEVLFLYRA